MKYLVFSCIIFLSFCYSQCNNLLEPQCNINSDCEWIEDIENGWCGSFDNNSSACNSIDTCSYTACQQECNWSGSAECESYPGCSYSYLTYSCSGTTTVPCCSGGSYQVDNSFCQEIEVLECSEMNQLECINDNSCEWVEDMEWGSCSNLSPYMNNGVSYCNDPSTNADQCYTYTCYGGSYGQWNTCCGGGDYLIDNNSYCDDVNFILGDVNGDNTLNVADIVLIVDLILNSVYNEYSDMNQDGILNVIDVVELVSTILGN